MTKKKKFNNKNLKKILPYFATAVVTLGIVFVGSLDKTTDGVSLSLDAFAKDDYKISVDELSGLYVVADVSNALGLASAIDTANNYTIATSMYNNGQTSSGRMEKPPITDIEIKRGIDEIRVAEGETMDAIAARYGITTDQIRWSNGLKNTNISAGDVLYIPTSAGIVYTVKSDDTLELIVSKYGSSVAEIVASNNLEISGLVAGSRILIKGGSLPEKERPEYVAPAPRYSTYTYVGSSASRQNIEVIGYFYNLGGPYGRGQCTQWAWYNRQDLPANLGNANTWATRAAAAGYRVDHTPAAGAVFQSSSGWYGHVGYVESVNPDGSIVASEMNYNYTPYRAIRSTIPANVAAGLFYIH